MEQELKTLKTLKKEIVHALSEKELLISPVLFSTITRVADRERLQALLAKIRHTDRLQLEELFRRIRHALPVSRAEAQKEPAARAAQSLTAAPLAAQLPAQAPDAVPLTITHSSAASASSLSSASPEAAVKVLFSYEDYFKRRELDDFVQYYNHRYTALEKMLRGRQELQSTLSINRVLGMTERDSVSMIGMVADKQTTKKGNIILTIEDQTGRIKVVVTLRNEALLALAKDIVPDEVVGVRGACGDKVVFAQNIFLPDVPLGNEQARAPTEGYAAFLSDLHVGSKKFLAVKFHRFLQWIRGEAGTAEQRELAKKLKYLFIIGDLVDGVGIYPAQLYDLEIADVKEQYQFCASLLKQVPSHVHMIICPGNHDAMRIAEPQPVFYKEFSSPLLALGHTTFVTNPSLVNIDAARAFSGLNVLLYHGYSFDYYVSNVDSIRRGGGYERPDLLMKFLLQRRHLAPTHTSTRYIPDVRADYHVIENVPDFFVTGHLHKAAVAKYRNVTMICGSCWQDTTAFQERVGHKPEPARVPIVNLQTREVRILRF